MNEYPKNPYPLFYHLLGNNLIAGITNNFVWFALTFWAIIETGSVVVASFIAGIFAVTNMIGAVLFGGFVDHHRKQTAMVVSSIISLVAFALGTMVFFFSDLGSTISATSPLLWVFVSILMLGTVAGNMRTIALATSATILFPAEGRDRANGLIATMQGISFAVTSVLSGVVIGFFGMATALTLAVGATLLALFHVALLSLPETISPHTDEHPKKLDLKGTIAVIVAIPGLIALIVFNTFNNLLGGVFMALMDVYGLSLMSVQNWGFLMGVMSLCMIGSGVYVATYGVGKNPLRTIMLLNVVIWISCLIFPLQASIPLLIFGMVVGMSSFPIIEAAEQTVIQNIVPPARQGRVFGFAQSVESAASPVTAFLIGPLAAIFFIPFMTTGFGVELIGNWFGTGESRGIALVFITAGFIGLIVTLLAWVSRPYQKLSYHYLTSVSAATARE